MTYEALKAWSPIESSQYQPIHARRKQADASDIIVPTAAIYMLDLLAMILSFRFDSSVGQ